MQSPGSDWSGPVLSLVQSYPPPCLIPPKQSLSSYCLNPTPVSLWDKEGILFLGCVVPRPLFMPSVLLTEGLETLFWGWTPSQVLLVRSHSSQNQRAARILRGPQRSSRLPTLLAQTSPTAGCHFLRLCQGLPGSPFHFRCP